MENSAPSLKIFRTKFSTSALYNGRNKNRRQNPVWEFTKTIIPFALVGYEVIISNSGSWNNCYISIYPHDLTWEWPKSDRNVVYFCPYFLQWISILGLKFERTIQNSKRPAFPPRLLSCHAKSLFAGYFRVHRHVSIPSPCTHLGLLICQTNMLSSAAQRKLTWLTVARRMERLMKRATTCFCLKGEIGRHLWSTVRSREDCVGRIYITLQNSAHSFIVPSADSRSFASLKGGRGEVLS